MLSPGRDQCNKNHKYMQMHGLHGKCSISKQLLHQATDDEQCPAGIFKRANPQAHEKYIYFAEYGMHRTVGMPHAP